MTDILARLRILLSAESGPFKKDMEESRAAVKSFKSSIGEMAAGLGIGALSIGMATKFLRDSSRAADEAAKVQAQLNSVILSTGGAAGVSAGQVNAYASELSRLTGVEDDEIVRAEALLLTFTKVGEDIFPKATEAALDMSVAMGQSLQSSIIMIGKALNDPIMGVTALRRVGVALTEEQETQIRQAVEMNDLYSAQGVILKELQVEFGGTAKAVGDASLGIDKLNNAVGNVQEGFGEYLNQGLKPVIEGTTNYVEELALSINIENELIKATKQGIIAKSDANTIITAMTLGVISEEQALWALTASQEIYTNKLEKFPDEGERARMMHLEIASAADEAAEANSRVALAIGELTLAALGKEALDALNQAYQDGALDEEDYEREAGRVMSRMLGMPQSAIDAQMALMDLKEEMKDGTLSAQGFADGVQDIYNNTKKLDGLHVKTVIDVQVNQVGTFASGGVPVEARDVTPEGKKLTPKAPPSEALSEATELRQWGGEVRRGRGYWVGEDGPEPYFPRVDGYILNHADAMAALGRAGVQIGSVVINAQPGQDGGALYRQFKAALDRDVREQRNSGAEYAG